MSLRPKRCELQGFRDRPRFIHLYISRPIYSVSLDRSHSALPSIQICIVWKCLFHIHFVGAKCPSASRRQQMVMWIGSPSGSHMRYRKKIIAMKSVAVTLAMKLRRHRWHLVTGTETHAQPSCSARPIRLAVPNLYSKLRKLAFRMRWVRWSADCGAPYIQYIL